MRRFNFTIEFQLEKIRQKRYKGKLKSGGLIWWLNVYKIKIELMQPDPEVCVLLAIYQSIFVYQKMRDVP